VQEENPSYGVYAVKAGTQYYGPWPIKWRQLLGAPDIFVGAPSNVDERAKMPFIL